MTNWKTTVFALVTAFFGFVLFQPAYFPPILRDIAAYIFAGGLAAFGISAADIPTRPKFPPPQDPTK